MRALTIGTVALLVALALTAFAGQAAAQEGDAAGNASLSVSQQIDLVMTENREEIRQHVQDRGFEISLDRSENGSEVAQERLEQLHEQVEEAQRERQSLVKQLRNGTMTPQEFAAEVSKANRQISRAAESMERVENETERRGQPVNATEGLNESLRNAVKALKGKAAANVSVLDTAMQAHELASRARSGNFTGPEIAEFAQGLGMNRSRVGPPEGVGGPGAGKPDDVGKPDGAGPGSGDAGPGNGSAGGEAPDNGADRGGDQAGGGNAPGGPP